MQSFESFSVLGIMGLGPMELVILAVVGLLLFGNRLPEVMKNMGRGVHEFKHGMQDVQNSIVQGSTEESGEVRA